jgi:type IV fimbrial biogenesis protein FimT
MCAEIFLGLQTSPSLSADKPSRRGDGHRPRGVAAVGNNLEQDLDGALHPGSCYLKSRRTNDKTRGFTLVELLLALTIAAIFLVFVVPSYKSVTIQNRMASEINTILGDVQLARSAAVKEGVSVTICASSNPTADPPACSGGPSWGSGWIIFSDIANDQTYSTSSGDTLLRASKGVDGGDTLTGLAGSIGSFSGNLPSLTFNRMGGISTIGALSLRDSADTLSWRRCLVVNRVGYGRVHTQASNPGDCP